MRQMLAMTTCVVAAGLAAGCGSDEKASSGPGSGATSKSVAIDVGTGKPITVKRGKPRVAFLTTSGNLFLAAVEKGARDEAKRLGIDLTILDAKFDPTRQMEQVQNALQQGRYDALMVTPLDSGALCPVVTKQAVAKGVPSVVVNVPLCNRVSKPENDELWSPGTIAQVGWTATVDSNRSMFREVAKRRGPGKHVGALLVGPPLIGGTISSKEALKQSKAAGELGDLDVKYTINTDFTTPDGLAKTQTLLQAHPEVDTIMTIYSDITVGAVRAVKTAGKQDKVKIYDQGASGQSLAAVRAGDVAMTTAFYPYSMGVGGVKTLADAFAGKKVARWIGMYTQGSTPGNPLVIDKQTIETFKPEY